MTAPLLVVLKIVFSAGMVIAVTLTAERVSTRLAGVMIGFPLGVGLTLFFLGLEQGAVFAAESALWSMQGILAALGFCWCYCRTALLFSRDTMVSLSVSCLLGLVGYLIIAAAIRFFMPSDALARTAILIPLLFLMAVVFRRTTPERVKKRVAITWSMLAARAGFAALVILTVTGVAVWVGPLWSGLLAAFPTAILPSVVIIHFHYGRESVPALFRDTPLAMLAIVVFSTSVYFTFPLFGVIGGTILSYGAALIYLTAYELKLRTIFDRLLPS
jgi:hypothetical protein